MDTRVRLDDQIGVWSTQENSTKVAIHLAGLPNAPNPIPGITEFLLDCGFSILQPHYPGSYDSGGTFDPYGAYRCVFEWADGLSNGTVVDIKSGETVGPADVDLLSCHSYGTFTGMTALRRGFSPRFAVFFTTSFAYGKAGYAFGQIGDRSEDARWVVEGFPLTFRPQSPSIIEEFYIVNSAADLAVDPCESFTSCFVVTPGSDPGLDAQRSLEGAKAFIEGHPERFILGGSMVAEGAGHAVKSMLTASVKASLREWCG